MGEDRKKEFTPPKSPLPPPPPPAPDGLVLLHMLVGGAQLLLQRLHLGHGVGQLVAVRARLRWGWDGGERVYERGEGGGHRERNEDNRWEKIVSSQRDK